MLQLTVLIGNFRTWDFIRCEAPKLFQDFCLPMTPHKSNKKELSNNINIKIPANQKKDFFDIFQLKRISNQHTQRNSKTYFPIDCKSFQRTFTDINFDLTNL